MAPTRAPSKSSKATKAALSLLRRAHSPKTAATIHADKIQHIPLHLEPTSTLVAQSTPSKDQRARRQAARNDKLRAQCRRRRKKPQPLSASENRRLCLYDIPKEECKYSIYAGLHELWCKYIREILLGWPQGQDVGGEEESAKRVQTHVEPQQAGAKLASADFHGAVLEVVRSRCVGRVGARGIVVRDTMFTFEIVTKNDMIKTIPKEHTVFRFEVPIPLTPATIDHTQQEKSLMFELHGDQFRIRAPDRANRKFKVHPIEL